MTRYYIKRIDCPNAGEIYPLISQLNEGLDFSSFEARLKDMLSQNYFIVAALDELENIVALTGCWLGTKFYCGKYLEIDNFIVDKKLRGQSLGTKIIEYVFEEAKRLQCDSVTLNAYIENHDAHRFYDQYQFERLGVHRIHRFSSI